MIRSAIDMSISLELPWENSFGALRPANMYALPSGPPPSPIQWSIIAIDLQNFARKVVLAGLESIR